MRKLYVVWLVFNGKHARSQEQSIRSMKHGFAGTSVGDSCGTSTCPWTPQGANHAREEAEAVPAESVRLKWKLTKHNTWINFEKEPKTNGEGRSRKNLTDSRIGPPFEKHHLW